MFYLINIKLNRVIPEEINHRLGDGPVGYFQKYMIEEYFNTFRPTNDYQLHSQLEF